MKELFLPYFCECNEQQSDRRKTPSPSEDQKKKNHMKGLYWPLQREWGFIRPQKVNWNTQNIFIMPYFLTFKAIEKRLLKET